MKNLLLLLVAIAVFSCQNESEPAVQKTNTDDVVITGSIENYKLEDSIYEIQFYINDYLISDYHEHNFNIDSLGNFNAVFKMPRQQDLMLYYKDYVRLILSPGDSLTVTFDGILEDNTEKSATFSGPASAINKQFAEFNSNNPINFRAYYKLTEQAPPDRFLQINDSISNIQSDYITTFISENEIDPILENYLKVQQQIDPLDRLLNYELVYNMTNRDNADKIELDPSFFKNLDRLPSIKSTDFVNSSLTDGFINYYYYYLNKQLRNAYPEGIPEHFDSIALQNMLIKTKGNPLLTQLVLNEGLKSEFSRNYIENYENAKPFYDSVFNNTAFQKQLTMRYESIKELLENPVLPEKTELLTFSSEDPKTFLKEIIANANGKVIYIDNWATWCGPCKREFKESTPELKKKFGDAIEFVYLCHQSDKELWIPSISEFKVEGKHYFITKEQFDVLRDQLNITGFPTYNIINKSGDIAYTGFEYRPSLEKTSEILSELITQ
jgi:thiol-disulfide isomerase/thioredoxin